MNIIYLYDESSGEYTGKYLPQEDPLNPGVYLYPHIYTSVPVPVMSTGQVAIFSGGKWSIQPDYRGQQMYSQATWESQIITSIGPVPTGFYLEIDPFFSAKHNKIAEIDKAYQDAVAYVANAHDRMEMVTWPKQEAEARAYLLSTTSSTPLLSILSEARGITVYALASKVVSLSDTYVLEIGALLGRYQAKRDALWVATTLLDLQNIVW